MKNLLLFLIFFSLICFMGCGGTEDFSTIEENVISALSESTSDTTEEITEETAEETTDKPDIKNLSSSTVNCIWYNDYDLTCIKIEGSIKNNTDSTYNNMKIHLTVKDGNNNFLGVTSGYIESTDFLPGQWAYFNACISGCTCPTDIIKFSYRLEEI